MSDRTPCLAEITVEPALGDGDHGQVVRDALDALRGPDLDVRPGAVSTTVAGDLDDVLHAVQRAHRVAAARASRVVTVVTIESRTPPLDLDARLDEVASLAERPVSPPGEERG